MMWQQIKETFFEIILESIPMLVTFFMLAIALLILTIFGAIIMFIIVKMMAWCDKKRMEQ